MSDKQIIYKPEGYKVSLQCYFSDDGGYWVDATKTSDIDGSKDHFHFFSGAIMPTEEQAIAEWNSVFSKAPYQPEVK